MKTILKQFNGVVKQFGDNVAIKEGTKAITYKELDASSKKQIDIKAIRIVFPLPQCHTNNNAKTTFILKRKGTNNF